MILFDNVDDAGYSPVVFWPGGPAEIIVTMAGTGTVTIMDCPEGALVTDPGVADGVLVIDENLFRAIDEDTLVFNASGRVGRWIGGPCFVCAGLDDPSDDVHVELRALSPTIVGEKLTDITVGGTGGPSS